MKDDSGESLSLNVAELIWQQQSARLVKWNADVVVPVVGDEEVAHGVEGQRGGRIQPGEGGDGGGMHAVGADEGRVGAGVDVDDRCRAG